MRVLLSILGLVVVLVVIQLLRPVPSPILTMTVPTTIGLGGSSPTLPWPSQGQAAVSIQHVGTLGSYGPNTAEPIGSLAKMMVALLVLQKHPLGAFQSGPTLTMTAKDAATYQNDLGPTHQSLVQVIAGEKLTERQLLEALLIPSGNNIAVTLGRWVAGSSANFIALMNQTAKTMGMNQTHFADISGFSPNTVSSARDLLVLADAAMKSPAFRQIVSMPQVTLPLVGLQYNYDNALGHDGIVGIKTGSTIIAGGSFVFAAKAKSSGVPFTVVGVVLGQQSKSPLATAITKGEALVRASRRIPRPFVPIQNGQVVARITAPWAPTVPVVADGAVHDLAWPGLTGHIKALTTALQVPLAAQSRIGALRVTLGRQHGSVPLVATSSLQPPSLLWRLLRL